MLKKLLHIILLLSYAQSYAQSCPQTTNPRDGATNVPVSTLISWTEVEDAVGYYLLVGTTPGGRDLIDRLDVGNNTEYQTTIDFPANTIISIKITIRFGDGRPDQTCPYTLFETGDNPDMDCNITLNTPADLTTCSLNPENLVAFLNELRTFEAQISNNQSDLNVTYLDLSGNLIDFNTQNNFPNNVQLPFIARFTRDGTFCFEEVQFNIVSRTPIKADIVQDQVVCDFYTLPRLNENNSYYTETNQGGTELFPGDRIETSQTIFIYAQEFDCYDEVFFTVAIDKSSTCNSDQFPSFFTPNNDGINDFWQYKKPENGNPVVFNSIRIYDRYGKFLKQITQDSKGWDGNFNGRPLPTGGYWFKAIDDEQNEIKGFFTLKR